MEYGANLSLEHLRPLSQRELGALYDMIALTTVNRGRRYSIPESLQLPGYLDPVEYRYTLDPEAVARLLGSYPDEVGFEKGKSYFSFMTPHIYDEIDSDRYISSTVDIDVMSRIKGTDMEACLSYRIVCSDFRQSNTAFSGEFVQEHYREDRLLTEEETVLTDAGVLTLAPEERRTLYESDFAKITKLISDIENA